MGDIFKCVIGKHSTVPEGDRQKIMPLIGRRFFGITHPSGVKLMYTQISSQRVRWEHEDATKVLVMVAPPNAKVDMISPEDTYDRDDADKKEPEQDIPDNRNQLGYNERLLLAHAL